MSQMTCYGVWAPKPLSIFSATAAAIITIGAISGNTMMILVVAKDPLKKLRSPFLYFVVNLAITDLIVGIITGPIAIYTQVLESLGRLDGNTAKVFHLSYFISVTASILSLVALSVDRYVAITFPLKYRNYLSLKRCWAISGGIWFVSLTLPLVYFKIGYIYYLVVYAHTSIIVALVILVVTYVRIYKFLRLRTRKMKKKLKASSVAAEKTILKKLTMEKKVTRVFMTVLLLFIGTYAPATIMIYVLQFCPQCDCRLQHCLRDFISLLIASNSCVNPFLYAIRLKPFKQSLQHIRRSIECFCITRKHKPDSELVVSDTHESLGKNTENTPD